MAISSRMLVAISCLLAWASILQTLSAQDIIGKPRSAVLNSDPSTPTLVVDPNERFEEQEVIMRANREHLRPTNREELACFLPPLAGIHTATVGVDALANQAKATPVYEKACNAIANKKFDVAGKNIRKALEKYPGYAALWVLLGQVEERESQFKLARESCQQASTISPAFVPAYLCLADVAAHAQDWNEVLRQSDRALALDPATSAVSYMFNAGANFNLRKLLDAEKSALKVAEISSRDVDPRQLHYLLAEIYEAKGDVANEIAQLREFLKVAGEGKDTALVKQFLSKLSGVPGESVAKERSPKEPQ